MRIICPKCRRPLTASELSIRRLEAGCLGCGHVFSFANRLPKPEPVAAPPAAPVPTPRAVTTSRHVTVTLDAEGMTLRRRWFRRSALWEGAIGLGMLVAAVVWGGRPLLDHTNGFTGFRAVLLGVFACTALIAIYRVLATVMNTTVIRGARRIPVRDVRQLTVEHRQRFFRTNSVSQSPRQYVIRALLHDGSEVSLLAADERHEALFLEQEIEYSLGIEDDGR